MNNTRRRQIEKVAERIEALQGELEELQSEESEYIDNMPESLQETERFYNAETSLEIITEAMDTLLEATEKLQEIE